jgi:hypothetical protein
MDDSALNDLIGEEVEMVASTLGQWKRDLTPWTAEEIDIVRLWVRRTVFARTLLETVKGGDVRIGGIRDGEPTFFPIDDEDASH